MEVSPDLLERRSLNQPDNFGQRSQGAALGFCAALPCPEVTLDGGVDSDTSRTFMKATEPPATGAVLGYGRVSREGQDLAQQRAAR